MKQNWDQDVYLLAWRFAIKAHGNQTCPAVVEGERMPYAAHLGSVTMEVVAALHSNPNLDGNLAIQCALLHDTIEDTDVDYTMIEEHFGRNVASGVLALTKDKKLPTKKEQLLDSLERIILQPHEVWMVKLADRISNLQPPLCIGMVQSARRTAKKPSLSMTIFMHPMRFYHKGLLKK